MFWHANLEGGGGGGGGWEDIIEIENMTERKKLGFELDVCLLL